MEEMRDVVGFEAYFSITCDGRLWSKRTKKFVKQHVNSGGYCIVSTRIGGRKGKCHLIRIHRAVAMAFVKGMTEERCFVNHIDCCKSNNNFNNLEWVTSMENSHHAIGNGLYDNCWKVNRKISVSKRRISDEDVFYIREKYIPRDKNFGARALAKRFDVCHSVLLDIIHMRKYKKTSEEVLSE